jgi:Bacteriophage minor capsid protein
MSMHMPSEGIKDILVTESIGVFAGTDENVWSICIARMRDGPDKMICIFDAPGMSPEPGLNVDYPAIQIIVRGTADGYPDAWRMCSTIKDILLGRPSAVVGADPELGVEGDTWASITMTGGIMAVGLDPSERPLFSMNFQLIVHQGDLSRSNREQM